MLFRKQRRFPTLAFILLVVAIVWLLNELSVITIDIPWIPVILIIVAIGMIFNRFRGWINSNFKMGNKENRKFSNLPFLKEKR